MNEVKAIMIRFKFNFVGLYLFSLTYIGLVSERIYCHDTDRTLPQDAADRCS